VEREQSGQIGLAFDNYYYETRQGDRQVSNKTVKRKREPSVTFKKPIKARNSLSKLSDMTSMPNMPPLEQSLALTGSRGNNYQTPDAHSGQMERAQV
jgi:hypothetical protein